MHECENEKTNLWTIRRRTKAQAETVMMVVATVKQSAEYASITNMPMSNANLKLPRCSPSFVRAKITNCTMTCTEVLNRVNKLEMF